MRALVFDGPAADTSATRVAQLPVPEPVAGEVSIDVAYAGVNFKDVMVRRGDPAYVSEFPAVPGLEVAGTVRALGAGVDRLSAGERVVAFTGSGGLAEVAVADARVVVPVPAGVGLDRAAAAVGALTTAELLLHDGVRLRAGDRLVVHSAAGGVGEAVAQLARRAGAGALIGIVGAPSRREAALRAGYDSVLVAGDELAEQVLALTDGQGVDAVLDPKGTVHLEADLAMLAPSGRVVVFGNAGGGEVAAVPAGRLLGSSVSVGGLSITALAARAPERLAAALGRVLESIAAGEITLEPTVLEGLAAAPDAQQELADGRGAGKRVVHVAAG